MQTRVLLWLGEWALRALAKAIVRSRARSDAELDRQRADFEAVADARRRLKALKDELSR